MAQALRVRRWTLIFTEFEEGDYVVHLQHGIGRYVGLKLLPITAGRKKC